MIVTLVDTPALLAQCVADISRGQDLAVDLEGVNLCRKDTIWVVDITVLGRAAFRTNHQGTSLKAVLESRSITKVFYDCRNDIDALWNLHGVFPENVWDLQLQELCLRRIRRLPTRHLCGLKKAIAEHIRPSQLPHDWEKNKTAGVKLFAPEFGGSYEVFSVRPLNPQVLEYSAADVELLFTLKDSMRAAAKPIWWDIVSRESSARANEAKRAHLETNGKQRALAPTNIW